ncbi:hypothetical protein H4582DRAFT_2055423 [Lactarius indigo]|nr:hypothetical protein H4582DRAFT_2055423 [Lactarius indigo]
MHTEQSTYTSYPQLDGEESIMTESLCHNYPHPRPVAIEDLSFEDREILESIIHGRPRIPERRGKTRRYAAIFDEKGIPLPSATGVVIGGARSSMLVDEQGSETEPIVIHHHTIPERPCGFRAFGRKISSAARNAFTCHRE